MSTRDNSRLKHKGSFEDLVRALVQDKPTHEDSEAGESCKTTEDAPESETSKPPNVSS